MGKIPMKVVRLLRAIGLNRFRFLTSFYRKWLPRIIKRDIPIRYKEANLVMYVPVASAHNFLRWWDYEPCTMALFRRVINQGMTVVDIGAFFGIYTLIAARDVGNEGRVIALEPDPSNFRILENNIKANNLTNVTCLQKAAFDKDTVINLYRHSTPGHHSVIDSSDIIEVIKVSAIRLDNYLKAIPDVIKMDIEGGEPKALEGMRRTLEKAGRLVLISKYEPRLLKKSGLKDPEMYLSMIRSFGFEIFIILEEQQKIISFGEMLPKMWDSEGTINLFCVKGYTEQEVSNLLTATK